MQKEALSSGDEEKIGLQMLDICGGERNEGGGDQGGSWKEPHGTDGG